ncbi:hypothetical protein ACFQX7_12145 [Luedemannella flava]
MVNPEVGRRARHIVLLVAAWGLLMPGSGDPRMPGGIARANAAVPAVPTPGVNTAGLAVLIGNELIRPDGTRRALDLPSGTTAAAAAQVPGGWVVEAQTERQRTLHFYGATGAGRQIGYVRGIWDLTPDGRTLVAVGLTATPSTAAVNPVVSAHELPTLRLKAQQRFAGGHGPLIIGTSNDRVLLRQAQATPQTTLAAVWNLRTNTMQTSATSAWFWSLGGTATVLRRVDRLDASRRVVGSCVDAVDAASGTIPLGNTGVCTAVARNTHTGMLSPTAGGRRSRCRRRPPRRRRSSSSAWPTCTPAGGGPSRSARAGSSSSGTAPAR